MKALQPRRPEHLFMSLPKRVLMLREGEKCFWHVTKFSSKDEKHSTLYETYKLFPHETNDSLIHKTLLKAHHCRRNSSLGMSESHKKHINLRQIPKIKGNK